MVNAARRHLCGLLLMQAARFGSYPPIFVREGSDDHTEVGHSSPCARQHGVRGSDHHRSLSLEPKKRAPRFRGALSLRTVSQVAASSKPRSGALPTRATRLIPLTQ